MDRIEINDTDGNTIVLFNRKSYFVLEEKSLTDRDTISINIDFIFDNFDEILNIGKRTWQYFKPMFDDYSNINVLTGYDEYFDKEYDGYAYCWIQNKKLNFSKPKFNQKRIYRFTPSRLGELLGDLIRYKDNT